MKTKEPFPPIQGFLSEYKKNASGKAFMGRFECPNVQWIDEGENSWLTFTISAEELEAAAQSNLLWTDQDVQRGIRPDTKKSVKRELSLSEGYPDSTSYIFDANKADEMAEKLLRGDRLFLDPLIWNMRPGNFEAYNNKDNCSVNIYNGKIYLPDSHHRQQAILKAVKIWRESPEAYPKFSSNRQFKVELYFLTKEDEGNYFFDKNQLTKPTSKSKSYDLTTNDDLSLLAKKVIEKTSIFENNVNRVTDRLNPKNDQMVTLSTLREMMKTFSSSDYIDEVEMDGLATVASDFFGILGNVRKELKRCSINERNLIREKYLVDSAVMMHGYVGLLKEFSKSVARNGRKKAILEWTVILERFGGDKKYNYRDWNGDLFDKENPFWVKKGICKPGKIGTKLTVINTGSTRSECAKILLKIAMNSSENYDLNNLD